MKQTDIEKRLHEILDREIESLKNSGVYKNPRPLKDSFENLELKNALITQNSNLYRDTVDYDESNKKRKTKTKNRSKVSTPIKRQLYNPKEHSAKKLANKFHDENLYFEISKDSVRILNRKIDESKKKIMLAERDLEFEKERNIKLSENLQEVQKENRKFAIKSQRVFDKQKEAEAYAKKLLKSEAIRQEQKKIIMSLKMEIEALKEEIGSFEE